MKTIHFITSNNGKVETLNGRLANLGIDIRVEGTDLDIIEPQADTIREVSLIKAKKAFKILKEPVVVEDGGFEIEALKGFPGVYTKYALTTIGADGLLDLMQGKDNRNAKFVSCTTFIDEEGEIHQFDRIGGNGYIVNEKVKNKSEIAWSDIWYIFYIEELGKTLAECSQDEVLDWYSLPNQKQSLVVFTDWLKENLI
ncbi:MAG: non-canonical purine NTP pyrophosphatase [Alphaproteobacteria bacterium]|nr:non-canonical purine NTP pyrophosphatase [Alphaproteobacteria bacterium]